MENTTKIKQYIRRMAPQPYTEVRLGRVLSVEGDTCTVDIEGLEMDGVSLRPVQDGSRQPMRVTPAVGAYAIVADLSEGRMRRLAVLAVSEAEKIELHGGENGGLVNIESLRAYLGAFKEAVSGALGAIDETAGSAFNSAMQAAQQHINNLEDETIKH